MDSFYFRKYIVIFLSKYHSDKIIFQRYFVQDALISIRKKKGKYPKKTIMEMAMCIILELYINKQNVILDYEDDLELSQKN